MLPVLDETTPTCVDVMGDLYEADLKTMTCTAIYWSGKHVCVCVLCVFVCVLCVCCVLCVVCVFVCVLCVCYVCVV